MPSPLIRELRDGEEPAVARFLERVFGGWPPYSLDVDPADHLRWKLLRRPELRRCRLVAEIDGRLAGTFFVIERLWSVGGRHCRATDGVDNAVDRGWAHLIDLVVAPGRDDVVVPLIDDVLAAARRAGAAGCRCWSRRRHPHQPALAALGFFRAVHVSSGDSDHV
jgi:hypothetical protein